MSQTLNGSWNAQGLCDAAKFTYLEYFIKKNKFDTYHVQETFAKSSHKNYFMPGYSICRLDRISGSGGGLVSFIRIGLKYRVVEANNIDHIEYMIIEIMLGNVKVNMVNVYISKQTPKTKVVLKKILKLDNVVICGDLNAKSPLWHNACENMNGKKLSELLGYRGTVVAATAEPTHYSHIGTPSFIDIVITNANNLVETPIVRHELASDHLSIAFKLNTRPTTAPNKEYRNEGKANWTLFGELVDEWTDANSTTNIDNAIDLDEWIKNFCAHVTACYNDCVPLVPFKKKKTLVSDISMNLLKYKYQLRRQVRHHNHRQFAPFLQNVESLLVENIKIDKAEDWRTFIESANKSPKKLWQINKRLKNKKIQGGVFIEENLVTRDGVEELEKTVLTNDEQIAEGFANKFAQDFLVIEEMDTRTFKIDRDFEKIKNSVPVNEQNLFEIEDLFEAISLVKKRKAPGADGVSNAMIKKFGMSTVTCLTNLLNKLIKIGHWPKQFKTAVVVAIPKAGKPKDHINSYRPISLLSCVGKIFEKCIAKHLNNWCAVNNIIPSHQFGFKKGHSAEMQAARFSACLHENKITKKSTAVVVLDVKSAFPSVWVAGLMHKLKKFKLNDMLLRFFSNYLGGSFVVRHNGSHSTEKSFTNGLHQGSGLSPLFYNIFTSDYKPVKDTEILTFADDTCLLANSRMAAAAVKRVEKAANHFAGFLAKWKICINAEKSQFCLFPCDRKKIRFKKTAIELNGVRLEALKACKYLGIKFDRYLLFHQHANQLIAKLTNIGITLRPITNNAFLSHTHRLTLLKTTAWPALMYGAAAWATLCKTKKILLRRKFSMLCKRVLRLPRSHPTAALYDTIRKELPEDSIEMARSLLAFKLINSEHTTLNQVGVEMNHIWAP